MVYLKCLEIENVHCFGKKQRIDFTDTEGNLSRWTVILGDNGTGKTTLLKSIVSMLPTPESFRENRDKFRTEYELSINNGWRNAWPLVHKEGEMDSKLGLTIVECEKPFDGFGPEMTLEFFKRHYSNKEYINQSENSQFNTLVFSPVYCFAYGANRKMAETKLSNENFGSTSETLFRDDALLPNTSEYFLRLDYKTAKSGEGTEELERVKDLLKLVLPSGVQDIKVDEAGDINMEVKVKTAFGWVKLSELSLGYKTTIAWLVDFATKMIYYHPNSKTPFDEPAILIIDEIDLHMHPAWQREIIENLTKIFTKTQFIVTAHSPLVAQAALDANLVLLKRANDHVVVNNAPDIIRSWRIDQVLASDLFGVKNVRNRETETILKRRRRLLLKEDLLDNEKRELEQLDNQLDEIPVAETPEYIKAMELVLKISKQTV